MNVLTASIFNETQKVFSKKKTVALYILSGIIPVAAAIIISVFQNRLGIQTISYTEFPVMILGIFTGLLLPLFVCMTAIDMFSGETGERNLKSVLLRPVTRFKVYLSKITALGVHIALHLILVFFSTILFGLFLEGKEQFLQGVFRAMTAYSTAFLPMLLFGIVASFVAQFFKNSTGALIVCILLYFAANIASTVFPGISDMVLTNYNDWHNLWLAGTVPAEKILIVFMFMAAYSIIFLSSGYYLFDRKEL